jgi:Icc-related predicted phosphoesterase
MLMRLFRAKERAGRFRVFFATDIHGSDRCFRKFLNAASVYDADALVLGGDIAGKAVVPVVRQSDGRYRVSFNGVERSVSQTELHEVKAAIGFNGFYPWMTDDESVARMQHDSAFRRAVFESAIIEQLAAWCSLAAERLPDRIRVIITPGNDDPAAIDAVLAEDQRVECPEQELTPLGPISLASLGSVTPTPWNTEREFDEEELTAQIEAMLAPRADGRPLVFNFHCPPHGTGLDTVNALDDELRPVVRAGVPVEIPVGSHAVREAILRYQPVVALHGHIHEAAGTHKLGETLCINPGSEYGSGVLKGALVDFDETGRCMAHLITTG